MSTKFVFFDIDGTLWDDKMYIPESTKQAIAKLRENGNKAFLCSGRSRSSIQAKELLAIGFDGIVAACGNYIEMDGEILYDNLMSYEMADKVVETLRECKLPVVLEGPEECWIDTEGFEKDPYVDYLFELLGAKAHPILGHEGNYRMEKCSFDRFADSDWDKCVKILGADFDFIVHNSDETFNVVEMVPKGTSKATGIDWLCKRFDIAIEDTYAIGDSINDLDMLKFVGHSIAMGNGTEVAKEAAEYVTADLHEDGIKKALMHYDLI